MTQTTEVKYDISPDKVETVVGLNAPQISKRLGVSDERKYCYAWKQSDESEGFQNFVYFATNDSEMSAVNGQIKVTRSGLYAINASADIKSYTWATSNVYVTVNGVNVSQVYDAYYYVSNQHRHTKKLQWLSYLNAGDVVKLYADGGPIGVPKETTYLQVFEI